MPDHFLTDPLIKREDEHSLRRLCDLSHLIDFSSNDYLGFARSAELQEMIQRSMECVATKSCGSTGSRLISGNSTLYEEIELEIANFHGAKSGLIFNSGYDANLGLLASVPRRGDTIIYDELAHASIRDGIRLGFARSFPFRHNDIQHLEQRLIKATGVRFVVVESVYSMDGDQAPLESLVNLCATHEARLIVDEAHATGVFGPTGKGLVVNQTLNDRVFARVHTFGKAIGAHGAIVLGSETLRQFLLNFARSFIFTTSLPQHSLVSIRCAYHRLRQSAHLIERLHKNIGQFRERAGNTVRAHLLPSDSAIQSVIVPGNQAARDLASSLQSAGFDVRAILSPTVPEGKERIRICLHSFNRDCDIHRLISSINKLTIH